jgi:DNA-binding PadR family transcriptional regulator
MERRGWIEAEWGTSELGRRAKFYRLTTAGRRRLKNDSERWGRLAVVMSRALRAEGV